MTKGEDLPQFLADLIFGPNGEFEKEDFEIGGFISQRRSTGKWTANVDFLFKSGRKSGMTSAELNTREEAEIELQKMMGLIAEIMSTICQVTETHNEFKNESKDKVLH